MKRYKSLFYVYFVVATPQLHATFEDETLQPGASVSIRCIASGNPTPEITWTLDDATVPTYDRFKIKTIITAQSDVVSYVNVSNMRVEDGGEYKCHVINDYGQVAHSARMNVIGVPFIRPLKNVTAVANQDLVLKCHVAGYPIDSITWEIGKAILKIPFKYVLF